MSASAMLYALGGAIFMSWRRRSGWRCCPRARALLYGAIGWRCWFSIANTGIAPTTLCLAVGALLPH